MNLKQEEKSKLASKTQHLIDSNFEVIFPIHNEKLQLMVNSVDHSAIVFQLAIDDKKRIVPIAEVLELAALENQDLRVNLFDNEGNIVMSTVYHNCRFGVNLDGLFILSYTSAFDNIKDLFVYFSYESKSIFDENKNKIA